MNVQTSQEKSTLVTWLRLMIENSNNIRLKKSTLDTLLLRTYKQTEFLCTHINKHNSNDDGCFHLFSASVLYTSFVVVIVYFQILENHLLGIFTFSASYASHPCIPYSLSGNARLDWALIIRFILLGSPWSFKSLCTSVYGSQAVILLLNMSKLQEARFPSHWHYCEVWGAEV